MVRGRSSHREIIPPLLKALERDGPWLARALLYRDYDSEKYKELPQDLLSALADLLLDPRQPFEWLDDCPILRGDIPIFECLNAIRAAARKDPALAGIVICYFYCDECSPRWERVIEPEGFHGLVSLGTAIRSWARKGVRILSQNGNLAVVGIWELGKVDS